MDYMIYDDRLEGSDPKGNFWMLKVGEQVGISVAISRTLARAAQHGGKLGSLLIMAHGIEDNEEGGYGLLFCREDLTHNTVHMFSPLKGKIGKIVLLACGAAHVAKGKDGGEGDGDFLCRRLARATGAWVKASTYRQEYVTWSWEKSWGNDFGEWEGDCWWFDPTGKHKYKADMKTF
jgi:hypothetical protein